MTSVVEMIALEALVQRDRKGQPTHKQEMFSKSLRTARGAKEDSVKEKRRRHVNACVV